MTDRHWYLAEWFCILLGIAIVVLSLVGCARNSLHVLETTADGGTFEVHQVTISTLGSRTETGTGSVVYTGSADGFQLSAGAAVEGQQSQDPAASFRAVLEFMQSITAPLSAP